MANVQITQLPAAQPLTGTESVPIVQNGQTVQTTTGAISASPVLNYPFLTVGLQSALPSSRYFTTDANLTITDGGAQSSYQISLNGAAANLNTLGNGFPVKTGISTLVNRIFAASGAGIAVTNGNGQSGNPTVSLTGLVSALATSAGSGLLALGSSTTISPVSIVGTTNEISVDNGNALSGNPTVGLADNPVLPGTGSVKVPSGTTAQRPTGVSGLIRYNTDINEFEGYTNGSWEAIVAGGGVYSIGLGSGLLSSTTNPITSTGTIDIDTSVVATLTDFQTLENKDIDGSLNSLSNIDNASLVNSSITINGVSVDLGGSTTVTASTTSSVTFDDTGAGDASVATFDGSTPITVSYNTLGASPLAGSSSLTTVGTVIAGTWNADTIDNAYLTNSSITLNSNSVSLGGSLDLTPSDIGAVASVSGTANEITATGTTNVTVSLPTALTFTGKTVTDGTYTNATLGSNLNTNSYSIVGGSYDGNQFVPSNGGGAQVNSLRDGHVYLQTGTTGSIAYTWDFTSAGISKLPGQVQVYGPNVTSITPFVQTMQVWEADYNGYQLVYARNKNNGSDASTDFVAYNDASDVDSYFIDMGISSSNYTDPIFTVFPPNAGYVYTGGGSSGQASALLLGTSNAASDIIMFTGDTLTANIRATIKGSTGNVLIGTSTDNGYQLAVNGTSNFNGAASFGNTVTLHADPTLALQAATKQYVDSATSSGFVVHTPVRVVSNTFTGTGTTYNNGAGTITNNTNGAIGTIDGVTLSVGDRILFRVLTNSFENGVYTLTDAGSPSTPWIVTRATDFDTVGPEEIANNAYFFVSEGTVYRGFSYVLSQTISPIVLGTTPLPFTEFASSLVYTGGTNINIAGQVISLTGTVAATNGGTGTSTVTTGDLLYGSATDTWSKLPIGIAYKSLIVNASGTQVEWNAIPLNETAAVSGQLGVSNGGTGASTLTGYVKGSGTSVMTASSTIPTTDLSGTITNAQLANSSITINGSSVSLGGSTTVTATASNALTIGTGLSGTSYNGSAAVTIAIDSTVATLTGSQTLTNKTMSGSDNTFSDIPDTAITGLGTMSTQDANNVSITGGDITVSTLTATTGIFGGTF
jgi:hypothetical protein